MSNLVNGQQVVSVEGAVNTNPAQQQGYSANAQTAYLGNAQNGVVVGNVNAQAMFTQEQLNSIISGRIAPLNQRISDLTNQLEQQQKLSNSYLNELTGFKQRDVVTKAGVPSQFVDFAVFEANKLAVNGKSFEDAVKEYISSNQQLFGVSQMNNQTPPNTSPTGNGVTQGVANPAQVVQQQQQPANNTNFYNSQVQVSGSQTGVNPQGQSGNTQAQPYSQAQAQVGASVPTGQTVVGSMGYQFAGNPQSANNIQSEVSNFLKAKGISK